MRKLIVFFLCFIFCFLFASCSENSTEEIHAENTTVAEETTSKKYSIEYFTDTENKKNIENYSTEYVEPDFKVVSTVKECYNYFDINESDSVKTENDSEGRISLITVSDKNGNTTGSIKFKYSTETVATVVFYENGETAKKVVFAFRDESTLSYIARITTTTEISLYIYNDDGSFKCYVDSAGFASLLTGAVMDEVGGSLF